MAVRQAEDGLMLRVEHDAFRRDADHLARAVERQAPVDPVRRRPVLNGWEVFARQLRRHHANQDEFLWPALRGYLLARPDEVALIDAMEAEHRRIEPLIGAVDTALHAADLVWLGEAAARFREELLGHLRHEEDDAVPLLVATFAEPDWRAFAAAQRKATGRKGAAEFLPYILSEADPETVERLTAQLPTVQRWELRHQWAPRFARLPRWESPSNAAG